jgi:hypothetical protein
MWEGLVLGLSPPSSPASFVLSAARASLRGASQCEGAQAMHAEVTDHHDVIPCFAGLPTISILSPRRIHFEPAVGAGDVVAIAVVRMMMCGGIRHSDCFARIRILSDAHRGTRFLVELRVGRMRAAASLPRYPACSRRARTRRCPQQ